MVEYHVNTISSENAADIVKNGTTSSFGAHLSARRDMTKPEVIFVGQDMTNIKLFLFLSIVVEQFYMQLLQLLHKICS